MTVVIVPAYKPDQTLAMITDQLWAYGCQVVVVDDGSGEEYQSIFNRVRDVCIVLTHSVNRGKGAVVKTALRYIKNEVFVSGSVCCSVLPQADKEKTSTSDIIKGTNFFTIIPPYSCGFKGP